MNLDLYNKDNYSRLMLGEITAIEEKPIYQIKNNEFDNNHIYRTIKVTWISGRRGTSDNVNIPSNIHCKGYGIDILPCVGDLVICGMEENKTEQVIAYRARSQGYLHGVSNQDIIELNKFGDVQKIDNISIPSYPFRYIKPGEISIISLGQFEIFLDINGTCRLIARDKETNWENPNRTDIKDAKYQFLGNRLWELAIGKSIINEGTKEIEKTEEGNNKQIWLKNYNNNIDISIDDKGNFAYIKEANEKTKDTKQSIKFSANGNISLVKESSDNIAGYNFSIGNNGNLDLSSKDYALNMDKEGNLELKGKDFTFNIKDKKLSLSINGMELLSINTSAIQIGKGTFEPAVLGTTLETFLKNFVTTFNTHVHTGNLELPTSAPIKPVQPPMKILSDLVKVSK